MAVLSESPMLSSEAVAAADALEDVSDLAESLPLSEQALSARGRTAAAATVMAARRIRVFMVWSRAMDSKDLILR